MHPRTLVCILALAALPAAQSAACVNKFANFTTCAYLNGVPADGDLALVTKTKQIESSVKLEYEADPNVIKSEACLLMYNEFKCLQKTTSPIYSAPCADDGTRLKPCFAMCTALYTTCYKRDAIQIDFDCTLLSVPKTDAKCFGSNGVLGMKSAAGALSASWAVAPLALAVARLGASSL